MDHNEIKMKLSAYYDGELSQKKREELLDHIGNCPECRQELENLVRIKNALVGEFEITASPQFSEFLMEKILKREVASRGWWGLPRWEVAFAISTLFIMFSYFVAHTVSSSQEPGQREWFFSYKDVDKEDALQIALGTERSNGNDWEEILYE